MANLVVRAISAMILIPLTTRHMPPEDLGFWYIFSNIFAFVLVIDVGLSATIGRLIASRFEDFSKITLPRSNDQMRFFGTIRRFYLMLLPLTFGILSIAGGTWIWTKSGEHDIARLAWLIFCPSFALSVVGNLGRGLLFGVNRLDLFNILSTVAALAQLAVAAIGLIAGFSLLALVCGNVTVMALLALMLPLFLWLAPGARYPLACGPPDRKIAKSILTVASGTFLNTASTFGVLNATLLIASQFLPLSTTASYGLTLQCFFLASQASSVWLEIKHPVYAKLLTENPSALQKLFISRMRLFLLTFAVCTTLLVTIGNKALTLIGAQTLLLPATQLLTLGAFVMLYSHHSHFEMLGLCLGKNPFTRGYLLTSAIGLLAVLFLTPRFGLWGALLSPLLAQLAFNNWWVPLQGMRMMQMPGRNYLPNLFGIKPIAAK